MGKAQLLVFAGKPGAGKTSVIKELFSQEKVVDVLTFVEEFCLDDGSVPEEKTMVAYQNMYSHLAGINDPLVILEIGTNYPELNINQLEKLLPRYEIEVFLCQASPQICLERARERGMRHNTDAWERRMKRDFPNTFSCLLENTTIPYKIVDMEKSLADTVEIFNQFIKSKKKPE